MRNPVFYLFEHFPQASSVFPAHPRGHLHEHSVLQMPPGASWHLYLLSVEQALHSDLCEKQDCRTSCTQDKPHSAAPPRAHLESGDFLETF